MKITSGMVGLIAVIAFAVCGSAASTASAICLHIDRLDPKSVEKGGQFLDPHCKTAQTKGLYIEAIELGTELAPLLYCAKVKEKTGVYKDPDCKEAGEKEEYIKVKLPGWLVNGTGLAVGATLALATTARVDESSVLNVPSLGIRLTCTGGSNKVLTGIKPYIQGPSGGGAEKLIFEGCSEISPPGCTIEEEVKTEAVIATLEPADSLENRILFSPKSGTTFADITFSGSCSLSGEKPVKGKVVLGSSTGGTEETSQPLQPIGTVENNSLEQGGSKAYLEKGSALLTLAAGGKWSFS